ncbi:MAG: UPF0280 family protein [Deltaproteobacteria bacterium]|nr:UPF0280 family protein [Deltaproteobacteria bacterium]
MRVYKERTYRGRAARKGLVGFRVAVRETDLWIQAASDLSALAREAVIQARARLERYIERFPEFARTLAPWPDPGPAPNVVRAMVRAGRAAGVGPMAAVAGAIAEAVGTALLAESPEVVVENGGDVFFAVSGPFTVGVFAGRSPLSDRVGMRISGTGKPMGLCTSSGTVGHSLSAGRADAACILADSCSLADAAATACGNRVQDEADISRALPPPKTP